VLPANETLGAEQPSGGPHGHLNWRCFEAGLPPTGAMEFSLYGDGVLFGDAGDAFGPYRVFNSLAFDREDGLRSLAVLRADFHLSAFVPKFANVDTMTFHGGAIDDELTSLMSLALGARLYSGGTIRIFEPGSDARGRPFENGHRRPNLSPVSGDPIIPSALTNKDLAVVRDILSRYRAVSVENAIDVVRSARAYQQGLWMAESDPEYAWLKFVSSLETAANCWSRADDSPEVALRNSRPDLAASLDSLGSDAVSAVAPLLKDQFRSTHKFLRFTERYRPAPPAERPEAPSRVDWNDLSSAMRMIYGYRSKSLHAGLSFPTPLIRAPMKFEDGAPHVEKPIALGSSMYGSYWPAESLPMHLHVFEFLTRETLKAWLADEDEGPSTTSRNHK
jgi:hypothetical protein